MLTLDTGHVVAFDDTVHYSVRKAGSWKSTILGAEGLVTDFTGPGRVWLQTRSSSDLVAWIQSKLPPPVAQLTTPPAPLERYRRPSRGHLCGATDHTVQSLRQGRTTPGRRQIRTFHLEPMNRRWRLG